MGFYSVVYSDDCLEKVKWDVKAISGEENAEGFIVQHMIIRDSTVEEVKNDDYWEAWKVCFGEIEDSEKYTYDDKWSPFIDIEGFELTPKKGATEKTIIYESKVYWISKKSKLYDTINAWKKGGLFSSANELRMTHEFLESIDCYYVCKRFKRMRFD